MAKHSVSALAKEIYGASDDRVKQLQQLYTATQTQIVQLIDHFIADDRNWTSKAPASEVRAFMQQLQALADSASDDSAKKLMDVTFNGKPVPSTNGDLLNASINYAMINLALAKQRQVSDVYQSVPNQVYDNKYSKPASIPKGTDLNAATKSAPVYTEAEQSDALKKANDVLGRVSLVQHGTTTHESLTTPTHKTSSTPQNGANLRRAVSPTPGGRRYTPALTRQTLFKIKANYYKGTDPYKAINEAASQAMLKLNHLVEQAVRNHQKPQDYTQQVMRLLTGGGTKSNGDMGKAASLIRTQAAHVYTQSKLSRFSDNGATQYQVVAIDAESTCDYCENDMDGTIFNIDDAEPGLNCPPFHPNCQCDIIEVPSDNYEHASMVD
ncbi:minor capsid protein [Lacticaseibacillus pantheris]|nr:minor capsid protein [Lacticaseibacillus pantheris]